MQIPHRKVLGWRGTHDTWYGYKSKTKHRRGMCFVSTLLEWLLGDSAVQLNWRQMETLAAVLLPKMSRAASQTEEGGLFTFSSLQTNLATLAGSAQTAVIATRGGLQSIAGPATCFHCLRSASDWFCHTGPTVLDPHRWPSPSECALWLHQRSGEE